MTKLENTNCIKTKFFDKKNIAKQTIAVLLTAINVCTPMMTCAQTNSSVDTSDNTRFQKFKKVKESFDDFARRGFKEISDFAKKNPKTTGMLTIFGVLSTFGVPVIANNLCDYIENSQKIARDANGIAEHLFGYVHEIFSNIDKNPEKYYELYSENTENLQQKIKLKTKNNSITNFVSLAKYYGFNMDEKIFELSDKKQKLDINIIVQQLINTAPNENLKNAIEKVFSKEKISSFVQQNDLQKTILQLDKAKKVWKAKKQQFEKDLNEYIGKLNSDPTLGLINEYNSWVLECKQYDIANEDLESAYQNALNSENIKREKHYAMFKNIYRELNVISHNIGVSYTLHYAYENIENNGINIYIKKNSNLFQKLFNILRNNSVVYDENNIKNLFMPSYTASRDGLITDMFKVLIGSNEELNRNFETWKNTADIQSSLNTTGEHLVNNIQKLTNTYRNISKSDTTVYKILDLLSIAIDKLKDNPIPYYTNNILNKSGQELFNDFVNFAKSKGIDISLEETVEYFSSKHISSARSDKRGSGLITYLISKTNGDPNLLQSFNRLKDSKISNEINSNILNIINTVKESSSNGKKMQVTSTPAKQGTSSRFDKKKFTSALNFEEDIDDQYVETLKKWRDEYESKSKQIKVGRDTTYRDGKVNNQRFQKHVYYFFRDLCNYVIDYIQNSSSSVLTTTATLSQALINFKDDQKVGINNDWNYAQAVRDNRTNKYELTELFNKNVLYDTMTETTTEGRIFGIGGRKVVYVSNCLSHFFKIALIANKACNCNIDLDIEYKKGTLFNRSDFDDELRVNEYNKVLKQAKDKLGNILK